MTIRRLLLILLLASALSGSRSTRHAAADIATPPDLSAFTDAGATVTMLAATEVGESPDGNQVLTLSRLAPDASGEPAIVLAGGPELWFVESGELSISGEHGFSQTATAGQQVIVPDQGQYTVSFRGESCTSALRLEFSAVIAMKISTDETAPALGPDGIPCPVSATLFEAADTIAKRPVPALGFIARVTWPGETFVSPSSATGPLGFSIESGTVRLSGPETMNAGLGAGSWAAVAAGQTSWTYVPGTSPASGLIAGAVSAVGSDLPPTPTPSPTPEVGVHGSSYVSPSYGYRLTWDETWSVTAEASQPGSDSLQLTNGVSNVYLQSYGDYSGDAIACVNDIATNLPTQTGFSDVAPRQTADGKPLVGGDETRRFGVYDFTYTTESGTSNYTEYIDCRVIIPGQSVLVITQIVLAERYTEQIEPVRRLLDALSLP